MKAVSVSGRAGFSLPGTAFSDHRTVYPPYREHKMVAVPGHHQP